MSTVAQAIEQIRNLAETAAKLDAELDKRHGIDRTLGVDVFDSKAIERRYATNDGEVRLEEYLNSFDLETLRRIQAVMYSGRDGVPAVDEREVLRETTGTKEDVVRTIMEKRVSFNPYFDRGLDRAKADGIDLDTF
jgi:hypothetical protein